MKMRGNGLRLIRVFFRLVFEMIRNYKKLNNDPDHNFRIMGYQRKDAEKTKQYAKKFVKRL